MPSRVSDIPDYRIRAAAERFEMLARQDVRRYERKDGFNVPVPWRYSDLLDQRRFMVSVRKHPRRGRPQAICCDCREPVEIKSKVKVLRCEICQSAWRARRRETECRRIFVRMIRLCDREGITVDEFILAQFRMWPVPSPKRTTLSWIPGPIVIPLPVNLVNESAKERYAKWLGLYGHFGARRAASIQESARMVEALVARNPNRFPTKEAALNDPYVRSQLSRDYLEGV